MNVWFYLFIGHIVVIDIPFILGTAWAIHRLRGSSKPAPSVPAPGSLRERMAQNTALQTTQSMGRDVQNGMVDMPAIAGKWRGYLDSLPATAYGDNPQRAKERYVERISELQTGIVEALDQNDLEVLRRKNLVQPKDWIGIRIAESAQVANDLALPEPKD